MLDVNLIWRFGYKYSDIRFHQSLGRNRQSGTIQTGTSPRRKLGIYPPVNFSGSKTSGSLFGVGIGTSIEIGHRCF